MSAFREKNPVTIGAIGVAVIAAMMLVAFKAGDLPLIGGGDTYYAEFSEAGGLKPNDEVRIAGVRVGQVEDLSIDRGHVVVEFKVDGDERFGTDTGASIRVKTLLGAMYLALEPAGPGQLGEGDAIPLDRTVAPYDVVDAFSDLSTVEQKIDTDQLADSLDTLSSLLADTPDDVRTSLTGLSRLSRTLASRDDELQNLLANASKVSGVLAERNDSIETLFRDGDTLLRALYDRRTAVHRLLVATTDLSDQLSGLVADTEADLTPALERLDRVVALLDSRQQELDESLRLMAPFYRVFANTLGTGPWFDTFIQNLPPVPALGGR
jgi:phospholipid/cholesterol/gamma-HCH transport system substrate-binding protein